MGFVAWYTVVLFCLGTSVFFYKIGTGETEVKNWSIIELYLSRWLVMLPIIGRAFGWW